MVLQKSTTVRPQPNLQLTTLRVAFRALDAVAPALGARWAARLWCTVPTGNGRRRDDRPIPGLFVPPSEVSTVTLPGGRRVVTEAWGEGLPVYLVHGWGGWRGQLGAFVEPLLARGSKVVAFDAPSHGESGPGVVGPGRSMLPEIAEAFRAVVDEHGKPAGVVAHSLGCAAVALAIQDGLEAPKVGFVAPTVEPIAHTRHMARALGFSERTRLGLLRKLETMVGRPMSDFDLLAMAGRTKVPPTLVVHDRDDREVPHDEAERLAASWPQADLVSTTGLGHQRIVRDAGVVTLVAKFVAP
ncbi:MAG: alpha/beta fold hydrolase [Jiangellaceae bacterium]